ncbi:acetate--CoA ligase family protein [Metallumcola ferriviriculae]|uniref:Acetate--CoA ligase family protein n=1 Tax=Metallumcola ferriviriculae TaxID=3039180 RepID=A0AAU0UTA5_9FIRM|nr:acetate--CoA ligase family protein [Desulfitibacteraceae bacterium MK1]
MTNKYYETAQTDLDFFFKPQSIAIIGASGDAKKPGGRPIEGLLTKGYAGKIFPVNPRYERIAGLKCYPSVIDISEPVDLAIISVPAKLVLDMFRDCVKKKVKAVIIFSSGFAETGEEGNRLQQEITDLARQHSIRVLGPNCLGIINIPGSVMASFGTIVNLDPVLPTSLGFVTQSGAYGVMVYARALQQGVGFSSFVSVGNEADLEFSDFIGYLLEDPNTKLIGGYMEGAKNGSKLRKVAERAAELQKPILLIKVGRSSAGSRAASSHTGSLAGDDLVYEAFFRQMGIIRIETLDELTSFAILHRSARKAAGRNVAILSASGGGGVVLADKCEGVGLNVPELTGDTKCRLEQVLPSFGSARNPIDPTGQILTEPTLMAKCMEVILKDDNIDMVILNVGLNHEGADVMVEGMIEQYNASDKPIVFVTTDTTEDPESEKLVNKIQNTGIPLMFEGYHAVDAMEKLVWYQERAAKIVQKDKQVDKSSEAQLPVKTKQLLKNSKNLTEYQCKQLLKAYGLPITQEGLATSAEMAIGIAADIGYPVVMKIQSPEILHKTEAKGIKLNLASAKEVKDAYHDIISNAKNYDPQAEIHGVLVQEMVGGGVEVIVGSSRDPVFGNAIIFGLGGIFVEALKDVALRIAPITRVDVEEMIKEIKGYAVLEGLRGRPAANLEAITDVILKISRFVIEYDIKELDINPLIVTDKGAKIVDALIIRN